MAKKKPAHKKAEPETQCGVTIGQVVWCTLCTGAVGHGRIVTVHHLNKEGPAMTIYDEISGAYRVGLIETITPGRPKKDQILKFMTGLEKKCCEAKK